jgi:hypothetical protein
MHRRKFLRIISALTAGSSMLPSCRRSLVKGRIVGASAEVGHLLRHKDFGEPVTIIEKDCIILGAGVSGLSAARRLYQSGRKDLLVLELEKAVGGNSCSGGNELSPYPWGAHYVPVPNNNLTEYLDFLEECGAIEGISPGGLPVYNELYLCFDPQERLFINGRWQEGLVPEYGLQEEDKNQVRNFLSLMDSFRHLRGADGRDVFAIPVDDSSKDPEWIQLDTITMEQWLKEKRWTSPYLLWYVDYCCRDDYGTAIDRVSAWAAIHYFASRKGAGTNARGHDVLTWPEGNSWLVQHLKKEFNDRILTQSLAVSVRQENEIVVVDYFDVANGILKRVKAKHCIMALPQFIAGRLLHDVQRTALVKQHLQYVPWMVANLKVGKLTERSGAPPSWDNVLYGNRSLGYVVATHEQLQQPSAKRNLTYYLPLTHNTPVAERNAAHERTYEQWRDIVLEDLTRIHPDLETSLEQLDIMIWGHAMVQPLPGMIHGSIRKRLAETSSDRIHFAHTDLAGISIFEEAFYQGVRAANKVLSAGHM